MDLSRFRAALRQGVAGGYMHWACRLNDFGKGDSPPPPDYTPMANASKEAAEIGAQLGREQLAENRRQYDQNMAVARPIIDQQAALMGQTKAQGDDYYNYNKNTFRPIEESLADEARTGVSRYNTNASVRAAVEEEASRASADVARASANADAQSSRAMAAMGVNPNSGRFASLGVGKGLALAASKAGASTVARQKGVALDFAKRMDVTGLGRGLPGASQGAYGLALNAGNSAVGNQNQTAAQYINGLAAANQTIMQGQGLRVQGLGSILGAQTSAYNAGLQADAASSAGIGNLIGTGIGVAAKLGVFSDRRLKRNIVKLGERSDGIGVYAYEYIWGGGRVIGVMADEVERVIPAAVFEVGGFKAVDYGML